MLLIIPPSYRRELPPGTLEKLYLNNDNVRYVKSQIVFAVIRMEKKCNKNISNLLKSNSRLLDFVEQQMLKEVNDKISYAEITDNTDPVMIKLHKMNCRIIMETANQLYTEPNNLDERYDRISISNSGNCDFNLNNAEYSEYGYSDYSFRGGQWHPEDLFTESSANRKHAHWRPLEVRFDPMARSCGNKYTQLANNLDPNSPIIRTQNYDLERVHKRYYDKQEKFCDSLTQINKKML